MVYHFRGLMASAQYNIPFSRGSNVSSFGSCFYTMFLPSVNVCRQESDVLPDQLSEKQKETKVDNLLRKIKKSGKIYNQSAGNKSSWFLVK